MLKALLFLALGAAVAPMQPEATSHAARDVAAVPRPAAQSTPASSAPEVYLDRALDILQANHIRRGSVDWDKIRAAAHDQARGASTAQEVYPIIEAVLAALGERHSRLLPPTSGNEPSRPARPERDPENFGKWRTVPMSPSAPSAQRLSNELVLVDVPAIVTRPGDASAALNYAEKMRLQLLAADEGRVCGWMIDLRSNGGGNMWPMLNGLGPLLGDPPYGAFSEPGGRTRAWTKKKGVIEEDGAPQGTPYVPFALKSAGRPLAVLVGPRTASSGEMVAIAFKGRPNTRLFGQTTAGLTTANRPYVLSDGAILVVTTAHSMGRDGKRYDGPVEPDVSVSVNTAAKAAAGWLAKSDCAASGSPALSTGAREVVWAQGPAFSPAVRP